MRWSKRFFKILVVGILVALLSIDTALACRFLRRPYFGCRPRICPPPARCYVLIGCTDVPASYSTLRIEMPEPVPSEDATAEAAPEPPQLPPQLPESTQVPVDETPDLQTEEAAPEPDELPEPVEESAPVVDDLFGPTGEQPAATIEADDLFGEPTPTAETPAETPVEMPEEQPFEIPVETPIEETPVEETTDDDLFDLPTETAPAQEQPAETEMDEDLFDLPVETAPAQEPAADSSDEGDLFAPPEEAPAEEQPVEEQPIEQPVEEPAEESEEDDLFGGSPTRNSTSLPGGLTSTELRTWTDNTLKHSIRGRLLWVRNGKVRIVKETGRTTTLPTARLSKVDRQFVHTQTVAALLELEMDGQTAQLR